MSLKGKTLFITGASRGIGEAIALRAARDGANIAIAAKTTTPHPKLPGTIYTAAEKIEKAGGKALPLVCDIRNEEEVIKAIEETVAKFGGIDIVVNNASAISITGTEETTLKKYDLMNQVNARGTWLVSKHALKYLKSARNPHILNLSPPLSMQEKWFKNHTAYTMAKYGMSMCVLGMAGELRHQGIAVNALWPATVIDTAAIQMIDTYNDKGRFRTPEIMADAAHIILTKKSTEFSGNFVIDELILYKNGVLDLSKYSYKQGATEFDDDGFIDDHVREEIYRLRKSNSRSKL